MGQRYVLFLVARDDGTFIPVAPDGRLLETDGAVLEPLVDGPVAEELRGKTKEHVRQQTSRGGEK